MIKAGAKVPRAWPGCFMNYCSETMELVCHRATVPRYRGIGLEAYLNGTSQGSTPEDARKNGHVRGRSRSFMKHPG